MKWLTIVGLMAACAMLVPSVHAEGRVFGDGVLPSVLEMFDTDGDGVLSEEERQAIKDTMRERHQNWVDRWDTDGDGVISDEERQAAIEALRQRIRERREEHFAAADTDGDGKLSKEEFMAIPAVQRLAERDPELPERIFNLLDANGDGYITLEEFLQHLRMGPGPGEPPDGEDPPRGE